MTVPGEEKLSRTPPADVRRQLRAEVGFGCPVPGCRSPFLQYHHFDPPWREKQHHSDGMIPLCPTHHSQADDWQVDVVRKLKSDASSSRHPAEGKFEWLRKELMIVTGGMMAIGTDVVVQFRGENCVWFNRDDQGMALLNVKMLTHRSLVDERMRIEDADFTVRGAPEDFECRPNGRYLNVRYDNGDWLRIEFHPIASLDAARRRYSAFAKSLSRLGLDVADRFPLASVEISLDVGSSDSHKLGRDKLTWPGATFAGGVTVDCGVALSLG